MSESNKLPLSRRSIGDLQRKLLIIMIGLGCLAPAVLPDWGRRAVAADDPSGQSDQIEQKLNELRKSVKAAASAERTRGLISEAFSLIDEALAADEYAAAIRVSALAVETAVILDNQHVSAVCARRKDEVSNIAKEAKKLTQQMSKLAKSPKDSTANFEVGRFRCSVRGDWDGGLPLLARGSNSSWAAVAKRDLAQPTNADERLGLGNNWSVLASNEKGARKLALAQRAVHWYRQVLREGSGDSRKKAAAAMESLPICYLTDMDEIEVTRSYGTMGKYGNYGGEVGKPIEVNGFKYPNSLGLHPLSSDEATVRYKLNSPYKTFVAGVGINDSQQEFKDTVIFLVIGDGEVLWKSPPVKSRHVVIPCEVNVKGVKTLELKCRCPDSFYSAHAVWLDPHLLK